MTQRLPGARRQLRCAVTWIVATVVGGGALAQYGGGSSELVGFQAGKIFLAPSLTTGYAYDNNVYQQSAAALANPNNPNKKGGDVVLTVQPALLLSVPFRNSLFQFGDVLTYFDYSNTVQTNGKTSNDAQATLTLNFASHDQLELSGHSVNGAAQTLVFDTAASTRYQGNRYQLNTQSVNFERDLPGVRGYRFALSHSVLQFDQSVTGNFYNFAGFDGEAGYIQPLSPNTLLSFGYLGSRYDHFPLSDPSVAYRKESGDAVYGQIDGQLGPRQPYSVRLGWQRLHFAGAGVSANDNFTGLFGRARISAIVGGGTMFTVSAQRQPYRSYTATSNFYVFDQISGAVERTFREGSSVGGDLGYSIYSYNQPDPLVGLDLFRQDRRVQVDAYGNLVIYKNVVFKVSLSRYRRRSNLPGADYNNTVFFGGFVLGWI